MNIKPANIEEEHVKCSWCGIAVSMTVVVKRKARNVDDPEACRDCRDNKVDIQRYKKWTHKTLGLIICHPWSEELDDQWRPIDENGQLVRPGERICGLKDCVKPEHVITPKPVTVSDIDMILMMHEMQQHNRRTKVS